MTKLVHDTPWKRIVHAFKREFGLEGCGGDHCCPPSYRELRLRDIERRKKNIEDWDARRITPGQFLRNCGRQV